MLTASAAAVAKFDRVEPESMRSKAGLALPVMMHAMNYRPACLLPLLAQERRLQSWSWAPAAPRKRSSQLGNWSRIGASLLDPSRPMLDLAIQ
jgi:hypothetical protein